MKILHLIYDHMNNPWVGGGGAVRVYELCRRLAGRGHEITVVSGRYPEAVDYKEDGLQYKFVGSGRSYLLSTFSYAIRAAGFLKKHGNEFDLVVEDFAPWNPLFSRFLTKKPVVLHINHREGFGIIRRWFVLGIPFFLIEAFYPKPFERITALSEGTKKKLKRPDAVVIPAGITPVPLPPGEIPETEKPKTPYIAYVGRLHIKNKGLDTLIGAMKGVDTKLVIVGRGRDEAKLKGMASSLKNVEFMGFLDEAGKLGAMKGAEIFVLPSRFEGWGIVVIEAAYCGTPVIVSDIPELSFALEGGFGVSFKKGDAKDLRDKINTLLGDEKLRRKMGENGRRYVQDYTWDRIAEEYEKYLRGVCSP
ncbi:MAG: glycosyltransferase family 4 protein [Thermodesulfovibrionales bacterium]|nr:glycosyltransferase family 4 protein [Thermodesulfovibrionales bacterium]